MKKICIRVDGNEIIGMGHVMRCLSLASAFREKNYEPIFLCTSQVGIDEIIKNGFKVIPIVEYDGSLINEAKLIREICINQEANALIVDQYNVSKDYFEVLRTLALHVAYVDDIDAFTYPVNILINGNITGKYIPYRKYKEDELMLLGLKYNMIRDEFKNLPERKVNKEVEQFLITMGGTDEFNLSVKFANWILANPLLKDKQINIVVGQAFGDISKLVKLEEKNNNIKLYATTRQYEEMGLNIEKTNMSSVMLKSDIAICGGGSTLYELCATGTIALPCILADNQQFLVERMDQQDLAISLGWYDKLTPQSFNNLLNRVVANIIEREEIIKRTQCLVDGLGCRRIVEKIVEKIDGR